MSALMGRCGMKRSSLLDGRPHPGIEEVRQREARRHEVKQLIERTHTVVPWAFGALQ